MLTSTPLRVAVLCSRRAPGIEYLLDHDANGSLYEIAGCVSSDSSFEDAARLTARGVTCISHPIAEFHASHGFSLRDIGARALYDMQTLAHLGSFDADVLLLSSYLYIVTPLLLRHFQERVINVHDSDLTILDDSGRRRFRGLHSTRDAIFAGQASTRATAHLVDENVDSGPILVRSEAFAVSPLVADALRWNATDVVKAYAYAHRGWVMRSAWGSLYLRSLQILAARENAAAERRSHVERIVSFHDSSVADAK